MREVRPTIKVLKALPRESFPDATAWDQVRNQDWANINLYGLNHPLLVDARNRLSTGSADLHKESTQQAGRRVYEVRDQGGAGWRGAVVLDDVGDPWLVFADRHDAFHGGSAKRFFKAGNFLPAAVEYKLRSREEEANAFRDWRGQLLRTVAETVVQSLNSATEVRAIVDGRHAGEVAEIAVTIDHSPLADGVEQAHLSGSLVTLVLTVRTTGAAELRQEVLNTALPFLQPDPAFYETAFEKGGALTLLITLTHAKLVQLAANVADPQPLVPEDALAPTHLHYVGVRFLTDAYIDGSAVRGVCGSWFVPTRDKSATLPVCPRCDQEMPVASLVLQVIERHAR